MTIVPSDEQIGPARPGEETDETGDRSEADEVVRLGDVHLSGIESLCVGESR